MNVKWISWAGLAGKCLTSPRYLLNVQYWVIIDIDLEMISAKVIWKKNVFGLLAHIKHYASGMLQKANKLKFQASIVITDLWYNFSYTSWCYISYIFLLEMSMKNYGVQLRYKYYLLCKMHIFSQFEQVIPKLHSKDFHEHFQ